MTTLYHKPPACPSVLLYAFLVRSCLVDARITGSASKFMPRVAENKVQFQLEAFRFQGADSGLVSVSKPKLNEFIFSVVYQRQQNLV